MCTAKKTKKVEHRFFSSKSRNVEHRFFSPCQFVSANKNPLRVLGIYENINFQGNISCTSPEIRLRQSHGLTNTCFLARLRPINIWYFSASAAGASEENFSDFGENHMLISVHAPPQGSSRGCQTPSNDFREYGTLSDPTKGSRLTPSDTSRGQNTHPLGPSSTTPGRSIQCSE